MKNKLILPRGKRSGIKGGRGMVIKERVLKTHDKDIGSRGRIECGRCRWVGWGSVMGGKWSKL